MNKKPNNKPYDDYDGDENEEEQCEPPELLSIKAIVRRLKEYVLRQGSHVKLTIHVDLISPEEMHLKEQYSFVAIPVEHNKEKFKNRFREVNDIVSEEMHRFFEPGAVKDGSIPVDIDILSGDDIEDTARYMGELSNNQFDSQLEDKPQKLDNRPTGFMSFKKRIIYVIQEKDR